jgi:hypothetical protein
VGYFSRETIPSGLPGTELENVLAERVALMDEPFCPSLSREVIREVGALDTKRFRRVHGQDARVVLHRWQYGAGFESAGHAAPRSCAHGQTSGILWRVQALARMR